ncbi:MAG: hypothetical protein KAU20_05760 [Nanoarchaeota archaeon]|nr:hypothetical protein [Nanoarchaeota archaeon]
MKQTTVAKKLAQRRNFNKLQVSRMAGVCKHTIDNEKDVLSSGEIYRFCVILKELKGLLRDWKSTVSEVIR